MNWLQELLFFFLYAGIGTTIFTVVILSRRWEHRSQRSLIGWLLAFTFAFTAYAAQPLEWIGLLRAIFPISAIVPFFLGPLLTNYIAAHYAGPTKSSSSIKPYIPGFVAFVAFSLPVYLLTYAPWNETGNIPTWLLGLPIVGLVVLAVHLSMAFRRLKSHRQAMRDNFSNLQAKELRWIGSWVVGMTVVLAMDIIIALIILSNPSWIWAVGLNAIVFIGFSCYLCYHAVVQSPNVWLRRKKEVLTNGAAIVSKEEWLEDSQRLDRLMHDTKPYLDPNLGLSDFAEHAGIPTKQLSEILNKGKNQNFYQYINNHRVAEFRRKLESKEHQDKTLLGLAFESGFNSKASFNRIFKEIVGETPRQYLRNLENRSQQKQ